MSEEQPNQTVTNRAPIWSGLAILVVLAVLAVLGFGIIKQQQGPVRVGASAPQFSLITFDGETYNTQDYAGQVIVVNFWASWCKPCEAEAVELEQAYQMYRDQGVIFLGVDYTDTEPEARDYLERFAITYPNGPDLRTAISQAYGIKGVPETYIIGPDGNIAAIMIGPYASLEAIIEQIEVALAQ